MGQAEKQLVSDIKRGRSLTSYYQWQNTLYLGKINSSPIETQLTKKKTRAKLKQYLSSPRTHLHQYQGSASLLTSAPFLEEDGAMVCTLQLLSAAPSLMLPPCPTVPSHGLLLPSGTHSCSDGGPCMGFRDLENWCM